MSEEKRIAESAEEREYRRTHSADGYMLGSREYPDNREARRALARTWKRIPWRWAEDS